MKQTILTLSSLEKVFPTKKPTLKQKEYTIFQNETFHFQVACFSPTNAPFAKIEATSDLGERISIRAVDRVPCEYPEWKEKTDDYVLNRKNSIGITYPDVLRPINKEGENIPENCWKAFWITVDAKNGLTVGKHEIKLHVYSKDNVYDKSITYTLNVLKGNLPDSDLLYTCWFHYDCISNWHGVRLRCERIPRHEVLADGFNDYRALKMLENLIGKERVMQLLDEEGVKKGFTQYPRSANWHLEFRRKINSLICNQQINNLKS